MPFRIEVTARPGIPDTRGRAAASGIRNFLGVEVRKARVRRIFLVDAPLSDAEIETVRREFTDPVVEESRVGASPLGAARWCVRVGLPAGRDGQRRPYRPHRHRGHPGAAPACRILGPHRLRVSPRGRRPGPRHRGADRARTARQRGHRDARGVQPRRLGHGGGEDRHPATRRRRRARSRRSGAPRRRRRPGTNQPRPSPLAVAG